MNSVKAAFGYFTGLCLMLAAGLAGAQDREAPLPINPPLPPIGSPDDPFNLNHQPVPNAFGIQDEGIVTIPGYAFDGVNTTTTRDYDFLTGQVWKTAGNCCLYAPVVGLPNGANITQIVWYIKDNSTTGDFIGNLIRHTADSSIGTGQNREFLHNSTGSVSGQGLVFANADIDHLLRADFGSGNVEVANYVLQASFPDNTGDVALQQVRILWRRQVSPAPGSATFNDVPTSHPFFQFVEALADSGITGGCGGGNYCPNDPVTRGQMAVFLSAALGLHWPAF